MKKRIISAIVALLIVIPLIVLGGTVFKVGVGLVGILGFYEMLSMKDNERKIPILIKVISIILFVIIMLSFGYNTEKLYFDYSTLLLILLLILSPIVFYSRRDYNITDATFIIAIILFLGISFNALIALRNAGIENIIYLALITIMTDTFAHFWGTNIGIHKLCPKVSPKKTIEGLIGGTLMGTIIGVLYYITAFEYSSLMAVVAMTLLFSLIGQLGDLIFSAMKRNYDIKDFGNIMPGHGGILDRLDSIIFVTLAYSFILTFL